MTVELLTEHNLEFLSLKGDCTGSPESTLIKVPHYWKSHVTAHMLWNIVISNHAIRKHMQTSKNILIIVLWFKYIFPIKFKIRILDLMLLLKNNVPFEGLYYSNMLILCI